MNPPFVFRDGFRLLKVSYSPPTEEGFSMNLYMKVYCNMGDLLYFLNKFYKLSVNQKVFSSFFLFSFNIKFCCTIVDLLCFVKLL